MRTPYALRAAGLMAAVLSLAAGPPAPAPGDAADRSLLQGLEWRNAGPHRGGRVVAATGVPGQPSVYYFGGTGGGVWKTTDAGIRWRNISFIAAVARGPRAIEAGSPGTR